MITEDELTTLLSRATSDIEPAPVRVEDLIGSGRRRRQSRRWYAGAGAAVAVLLVGTLALTTPWSSDTRTTGPTTGQGGCSTNIPSRVLPPWARAGFSGRHPKLPHVLGDNRDIAALLFGQPLTAPTGKDGRNNKILWVANAGRIGKAAPAPGTPLVIHAHPADGSASVVRTVDGGPGPSTIDLPSAGCWRLDLTWGGVTDSITLHYAG